jgi:hypothetical protein
MTDPQRPDLDIHELLNEALLGDDGNDPEPEDPPATKGRVLHWAAEAYQQPDPVRWLVKDLLPIPSVALLHAPGGKIKTYSMFDLSTSVSMGEPWLGFEVEQGTVLIIDEESGNERIKRRLHMTMQGHEAPKDLPLAYITLGAFDFTLNSEDWRDLQATIFTTEAKLIIVDALVDVMLGGDENAVKDVQPVFHSLRRVAEATESCILLVHHDNKIGGYRGSSAMQGAVDVMIAVDKDDDSNHLNFFCEKSRDAELQRWGAIANFGEWTFNLSPAAFQGKDDKLDQVDLDILEYLASKVGGAHVVDVISDLEATGEYTKSKIRNHVNLLRTNGYIERVNEGSKGTKAVVGLTTKGRAFNN